MAEFLTQDPGFNKLLDTARRAASASANVLVTGESGTGKNLFARFLHEHSSRSEGPFVEVACANLPPELIESLLFGHERGAFTGAHESTAGKFELAHGGTLFLDDVQELQLDVQAKVLRALEQRRFERLGGAHTIEVDVRFIVSTREDPETLVRAGRLREDLYYRLNVVRFRLPPLRERRGDIPLLARWFLADVAARQQLAVREISPEAMQRISAYGWPGNTRELRHCVESATVLCEGGTIELRDLPRSLGLDQPHMLRAAAGEGMTLAQLEAAYIREVLRRTGGNKSAAARILGIHRKTLHQKLRSSDPGQ